MATATASREDPQGRPTASPRDTGPELARYRTPPPPPARDGLSARQSAELERIAARHGHTTWLARADGQLRVAVHGDDRSSGEPPLYLLLARDGTISGCGGRARPGHAAPTSRKRP